MNAKLYVSEAGFVVETTEPLISRFSGQVKADLFE